MSFASKNDCQTKKNNIQSWRMCSFHPSCLQTLETLLLSENISVGSVGQFPLHSVVAHVQQVQHHLNKNSASNANHLKNHRVPRSHPWHAPQPPWISVSLSWLDYSLKASGVWHVCDAHCCILTCGCFCWCLSSWKCTTFECSASFWIWSVENTISKAKSATPH